MTALEEKHPTTVNHVNSCALRQSISIQVGEIICSNGIQAPKNSTGLLISNATNYLTFLTRLYVAKPKPSILSIVK